MMDATAGFGRDALALVQAGHDVLAVERHPLMHAILTDLAERLDAARGGHPDAGAWGRLEVAFGDSVDLLTGWARQIDVIYLDPMYRTQRRGKSRGALNWLDRMLDDEADGEAEALLRVAQTSGARRVVVKRPIKAAPLASGVTGSVRGRTTRYDIYPAAD
jgi:16S rRNA (guanine1516-N2)-methyltransferase